MVYVPYVLKQVSSKCREQIFAFFGLKDLSALLILLIISAALQSASFFPRGKLWKLITLEHLAEDTLHPGIQQYRWAPGIVKKDHLISSLWPSTDCLHHRLAEVFDFKAGRPARDTSLRVRKGCQLSCIGWHGGTSDTSAFGGTSDTDLTKP